MKKIFYLLCFTFVILAAGCSSKQEVQVIVDNPTEEINTALSLNDVKNGKSINTALKTDGAYHDVKVASNISSSLFYQTIALDDYVEERLKNVNLKVLLFNNIDSSSFISELNNETYGLKEEQLGVSLKKDSYSGSLCGSLSVSKTLDIPNDYQKKDNDPTQLVVMYLPVYCIYNDGSTTYTKSFMFVPVYYAFTYQSQVSDYTSGVKNYKIELNENNLLPSKPTQA